MWPHSISIGLDGKAIAVGTDAPEVVEALDPWRIPDMGEPTDYCLELHPIPSRPGQPRPLPGLYHGSTALLRTQDTARLTTALLRVLASHDRPAADDQVRVALMPVVRDGVALLAPPATIAAVPDRWLLAHEIEPVYTVSSLIDAGPGQVVVDPPLGVDHQGSDPALRAWWLPPQPWDEPLSPGFAVAEVMTLVTDVTVGNAASRLRAVAALVERAHPAFAPTGVDAIKDNLLRTLESAGR